MADTNIADGKENMDTIYEQAFRLVEKENDRPDGSNRKEAYEMLKKYYPENTQNYAYLWRLSRLTYIYMQTFVISDKNRHKELCFEAKNYAFAALALNDQDPEVHKYCSMTLGTVNDYVGTDEKIKNGHAMKHHLDEALKLRPDDSTLHHMYGRWAYGVAGLSWIERKIAAALYSTPPVATYDEAVKEFLEAEKLNPDSWKENQLYISLCYDHLGDKTKKKEWLQRADRISNLSPDDEAADKEIKRLLKKC